MPQFSEDSLHVVGLLLKPSHGVGTLRIVGAQQVQPRKDQNRYLLLESENGHLGMVPLLDITFLLQRGKLSCFADCLLKPAQFKTQTEMRSWMVEQNAKRVVADFVTI